MIISIMRTIAFILFSIGLTAALTQESRGKVIRIEKEKKEIFYTGSYALLIGESDYTHGWQDLNTISGELQQVEVLLQSQGFQVTTVLNLNAEQLRKNIEDFIKQYGSQPENRLLFFYAGHGYTDTHNNEGYLVPVDAPKPEVNEEVFLQKALTMDEIIAWARNFKAKHALFLFDSCFSGTVFKVRQSHEIPRQIAQAVALPVRQFITAGSANETVPARSVFTPAFVNALRFAWGDMNEDGYVTGQELGLYLWNKVPRNSRQTPQYGKITDYELSRGDFVFAVPAKKWLDIKVEYLYRRQNDSEFLQLNDEQILYSGDHYKIVFTPFEKSYVYIFQQGSSGKIYQLFPNKNKDNPIPADETYYVPAPNQAFYLDKQAGQEKIYLFASRKLDIQLEQEYEQVVLARRGQANPQQSQEILESTIKFRDPAGISHDPISKSDNLQLEQRLRVCEGCVSTLKFWHR